MPGLGLEVGPGDPMQLPGCPYSSVGAGSKYRCHEPNRSCSCTYTNCTHTAAMHDACMRLAFASATVTRAFNRGGLLLLGAAAVHREVSEQRGILDLDRRNYTTTVCAALVSSSWPSTREAHTGPSVSLIISHKTRSPVGKTVVASTDNISVGRLVKPFFFFLKFLTVRSYVD